MTDSLCDLHLQRASTNTDPTKACRPGPQLKPPETWPWASLTRKFSSVVSVKPLCVSARDRKLSSEWHRLGEKKNSEKKKQKKSTEANILCSRWSGGILSLACRGPTSDRCKLQVKRRHVRAGRAQREDSGFGGIVRKQLFYGWAIGAPPCTWTNWPTYWNIYLMRHWFLFSYRAPCRQSCQTPMSEFTVADLVAFTAQQPHARK